MNHSSPDINDENDVITYYLLLTMGKPQVNSPNNSFLYLSDHDANFRANKILFPMTCIQFMQSYILHKFVQN